MSPRIHQNRSKKLRFCLLSAVFALVAAPQAFAVPVRLSINDSSSVAIQTNGPTSPNDQSIAYFAGNDVGQANRRLLQVRVADPVLCADFVAAQSDSEVRFRLVDANGLIQGSDSRGFRGLQALGNDVAGIRLRAAPVGAEPIDVGKNLLRISTTGALPCYVFPGGALPAFQPLNVPNGTSERTPAGGDLIFADGYETPLVSGTELVTTITSPSSARAGDPVNYTIRVENVGAGAANNVQIRDFFIKPVAGQSTPGLLDGNWSCSQVGNAVCSQAIGSGYVFQSAATIPSGSALLFSVSRTLSNATPPTVGSTFRLQAAAFSQPSENEVNRTNNAFASAAIPVVTNVAPTISGLSTQTINEDTSTGNVAFQVNDPDNTGVLNVSATSANPALLSQSGIVLGGSGNNRTIRMTPNPNASGFALVTVSVSDGISTTSQGFTLQVNPVNDQPSFVFNSACPTNGGMVFTPANGATPATMTFPSGSQAVYTCSNSIVVDFGPNESAQSISAITDLNIVSNGVLFANTATVSPSATNASISFGINGSSGVATVTFRVRDSGGIDNGGVDLSELVTLRIRVPSATPTITGFANQTGNEDNSVGPLSFTVTDSDTALSALVVTVISSNPGLIPSLGTLPSSSNALRNFTLTPVADQFGSATITVSVTDGDQTSTQTFLATVNPVNDAPTFSNSGDVNFPTGTTSGIKQVNGWASNMSVGPANEASAPQSQLIDLFVVEVLNDGNAILSGTPPSVSVNNGRLTFNLRSNGGQAFTGYACLRVTVLDTGDGTPPNVNQSAPAVVKIRVNGADGTCSTSVPSRVAKN